MDKNLIFISSNFRTNLRQVTNILLVIGTFLIAINLFPISRKAKIEQLCTEVNYLRRYGSYGKDIGRKRLIFLDKKITKELGLKYRSGGRSDGTSYEQGEAHLFCDYILK